MSFSILDVFRPTYFDNILPKTGVLPVLVTTSSAKGLIDLTRHLYFNITKKVVSTFSRRRFLTTNLSMFVNCSGLPKSHILERSKLVLSFLMFKVVRILVLKLSKFRKLKALRLMILMRSLVASSFAFESAFRILSLSFKKALKTVRKMGFTQAMVSSMSPKKCSACFS